MSVFIRVLSFSICSSLPPAALSASRAVMSEFSSLLSCERFCVVSIGAIAIKIWRWKSFGPVCGLG